MATKNLKDQRRADLVIPYVAAEIKAEENDIASTISSSLPMAAMFTRNKMVGWSAVIFAVQGWLNETPGQLANGKQPAYFSVGMSVMALGMKGSPTAPVVPMPQ
ncbi:hypothetical protein Q9L58_008905 [Maublancomyces gigas]|uniref:Uncharacterized protein n=1 Tax=Discina gigas TaxID=1032678 RepID=A0ABR3G8F2_9PEZI